MQSLYPEILLLIKLGTFLKMPCLKLLRGDIKRAQYRFLWDEAKAQGTIGVEKKGMRPQTCKHPN